jgi:hypothetical protein
MHIVSTAQADERITVRVIPFKVGEHVGLSGPFTLLEFDGGLPDVLYIDAGRGLIELTSSDAQVAEYADNFENLLEAALSPAESLEFMQGVAEEIS